MQVAFARACAHALVRAFARACAHALVRASRPPPPGCRPRVRQLPGRRGVRCVSFCLCSERPLRRSLCSASRPSGGRCGRTGSSRSVRAGAMGQFRADGSGPV
jgi:hypothetical protein